MKKILLIALGIGFFWTGVSSTELQVQAQQVVQVSESITPRSDIIDWRYLDVDGHLYRRQYNYTKQEWIGEWERC